MGKRTNLGAAAPGPALWLYVHIKNSSID